MMPLIANAMSEMIAIADAPMEAATALLHAFIDGKLDSFKTHAVLVAVIAAAEIGLAAGIWLESPRHKNFREWIGLLLVLSGCVASVIATVALLIFDEGISRTQNGQIIALYNELVPRAVKAADVKELEKFGQRYPNGLVMAVVKNDWEAQGFGQQIGIAMGRATNRWLFLDEPHGNNSRLVPP
jgi:hypothetical protein